MLFLRKLLFYLFLIAYLALCPLTLLYAMGYLFRPGAEHGVMQTGLIALSTVPPGASIYLGDRRYTHTTPALLRDLLPGDYPVRLLLKNYRPWARTVAVGDGQSTALEHILLVPAVVPATTLLPGRFEELIPLPDTPRFLLTAGPRLGDVTVYDAKEARSWPLLPAESPWREARLLSWTTMRGSTTLLLHVRGREGQRWVWIEPRRGEARPEDVTDLLPPSPRQLAWDPLHEQSLFVWQEDHVDRVEPAARAVYPHWTEEVRGCALWDKTMYVLKPDGRLLRLDREGREAGGLAGEAAFDRALVGTQGWYQLEILAHETVLLQGARGDLLINRFPFRLVDGGVRGLAPDPQRERVLLWQQNRLGVLDLSHGAVRTGEADAGPVVSWICESPAGIEQAFWVYEGSQALVRDQEAVWLVDAAPGPGAPERQVLLRVKSGSDVVYAEETGLLYYLDRSTGALAAAEILPKRPILARP